MSDQLAVMNEGAIEQVGTPEDVYLRPRTRFVAGFLGAVNWINGIGVRPETTRVAPAPSSNGERSSPGTVTGSVFLGDCVQILVRLATGEEAVAQVSRGATPYPPGAAIHLCWNPSDEMTFS